MKEMQSLNSIVAQNRKDARELFEPTFRYKAPKHCLDINFDTEYFSLPGVPTQIVTSQVSSPNFPLAIGLYHYLSDQDLDEMSEQNRDELTRLGWKRLEKATAIEQFLSDWFEVETVDGTSECSKSAKTYKVRVFFFFSGQDIKAIFKDPTEQRAVFDKVNRKRRYTNKMVKTPSGFLVKAPIGLNFTLKFPGKKAGKFIDARPVVMELMDTSAMLGQSSLKNQATIAGVEMPDKDVEVLFEELAIEQPDVYEPFRATFSREAFYTNVKFWFMNLPELFTRYATGDLVMIQIYNSLHKMTDELRAGFGLKPVKTVKMSSGSDVAQLVNDWFCHRLGITSTQLLSMNFGGTPHSESLNQRVNEMIYLGLTAGGRATRGIEPQLGRGMPNPTRKRNQLKDFVRGSLLDIDIAGAYGNGLKNQIYPIGNPNVSREGDVITLREFRDKFIFGVDKYAPGLYVARLNCDNLPFPQDVLLSSENKNFQGKANNATSEVGEVDEEEKDRDASMALLLRQLHQAVLTHDLFQIVDVFSSRQEYNYLLDNVLVVTHAGYQEKNRREWDSLTDDEKAEMGENYKWVSSNRRDKCSPIWCPIPLADLLDPLIAMRKTHKKGTPMNAAAKLKINTIYGTIASRYFSQDGACVSNYIVGNNITGRVRALAWYMEKGLGCHIIVTDGGVFDVNKVNQFDRLRFSLENFSNLCQRKTRDESDHTFVKSVPLFPEGEITPEQLGAKETDGGICPEGDSLAWKHLKKQFFGVDIFDKDQFNFESKSSSSKLVVHNKVDHALFPIDPKGQIKFKLRGCSSSGIQGGLTYEEICESLFGGLEKGEVTSRKATFHGLLGFGDWSRDREKTIKDPSRTEKFAGLTPQDTVATDKLFYSHTPLYKRFDTLTEWKRVLSHYQKLQATGDHEAIAEMFLDPTSQRWN